MPDYDELAYKASLRRLAQFEREITEALVAALDEIRRDMSKIYERWSDSNGQLTYAEMTRYNRLATAEKQIVTDLNKATGSNLRTLGRLQPEVYDEAFFRHAWAMDQRTRIAITWGRINRAAMFEALADPQSALAMNNYPVNARQYIKRAISNGLARGKGYREMMRDIKDALNRTNYEALRIARTEGQRAINAGIELMTARAASRGIRGTPIWSATLDTRTRDSHGSMDQRPRDADGLFTLPNGERAPYPLHPSLSAANSINCRCRMVYRIDGYTPALRRTRDAGVVAHQSYGEWADARGLL